MKICLSFANILTKDQTLQGIVAQARRIADSTASVLMLGESGTGKELFAQALPEASRRKKAPFIAINCGAIQHDLIESELFGYEEGAFSGAKKKGKPGKFERANGGTLFLDEIGELPTSVNKGQHARISGTLEKQLALAERAVIESALREAGGNRALTARTLGIHRTALYKKMNRLGID